MSSRNDIFAKNFNTIMKILNVLEAAVKEGVKALYHETFDKSITLSQTRKEFEGDYTVVVFPFTKIAKKKPEQIGEELGQYLVDRVDELSSFNVVKGFLNLKFHDSFWIDFLHSVLKDEQFGKFPSNGQKVMVEFASPNTNKPLHLGHIRNILLGWSTAKILEAAGYDVVKTQIVNDRGIAICKSMLAWQQFGKGTTPESTQVKGDHFVGHYYVKFEQAFQNEYRTWQQSEQGKKIFTEKKKDGDDEVIFFNSYKNNYFNEYSSIGKAAKAMLINWEENDTSTRNLWQQMNQWVYDGFETTYKKLGVHFDSALYESDTYLLGKNIIDDGIAARKFYKKEDGSIWIDLENHKLDKKLVLRSDGTSVYITQDLGTADMRYNEVGFDKMIYVVGNEQDYHFAALFATLKELGRSYADGLYHLSYGMVNLPEGRMKSREGTVVDADDLIADVINEAKKNTQAIGSIADMPKEEQENIFRQIGLAALKFFILKVNPVKNMVFNPKESVDLQGQTGPYVQYSYVRANGVYQKGIQEGVDFEEALNYMNLQSQEKDLIAQIFVFPSILEEAAKSYDPANIANYCYDLAKLLHKFWHDVQILNANEKGATAFRLLLCKAVAQILAQALDLLGIEVPKRM